MESTEKADLDVAIIGGGVAGAYAAYRLTRAKDKLDVRLFEQSGRIGGRLWSYAAPEILDEPAEIGGLGFCQIHQSVYELCGKLGLERRPSSDYNAGAQFFYLRGQRFLPEAFTPPESLQDNRNGYYPNVIPFCLRDEEKWKPPFMLSFEVLFKGIKGFANLWNEINQTCKKQIQKVRNGDLLCKDDLDIVFPELKKVSECFQPIPFGSEGGASNGVSPRDAFKYGYWNMLEKYLSSEAYHLITNTNFGVSSFRNFNLSLVCLNTFKFLFSFPFWELNQGYQALPERLVEEAFKERKDKVQLDTRLLHLEKIRGDDGPLIRLTFLKEGDAGPEKYCLNARYVILAMPQRALKMLSTQSFIFQKEEYSQFWKDINTILAVPAYKLFMVYDSRWWDTIRVGSVDKAIVGGLSATDMPLRGCFYSHARWGQGGRRKHLLTASLSDGEIANFWAGYLPRSKYGPSGKPYTPLSFEELQASEEMVRMAQQLLKEMHGLNEIPKPSAAFFHDWTLDPYGGGWHSWNPFVNKWEVISRIRRLSVDPNVEEPRVFLCGEAYSGQQGWVEGAINTAEMVLEEYFGLDRPGWVHPEYSFGP